jgi:hypothetical protein
MSILNNELIPQPPAAKIIANTLKGSTKMTFETMVSAFNIGSKNFWDNPRATPSEIAQELGNDAREVFQLHYALGQLIASVKPEAISEGLALIGQFTMNEDGTVTIIEPE